MNTKKNSIDFTAGNTPKTKRELPDLKKLNLGKILSEDKESTRNKDDQTFISMLGMNTGGSPDVVKLSQKGLAPTNEGEKLPSVRTTQKRHLRNISYPCKATSVETTQFNSSQITLKI